MNPAEVLTDVLHLQFPLTAGIEVELELDASCREGRLRKFALKNNISGNANFNITLGRNGNIETVFLVDSDITETSARNGLIMELSKVTLKEIPIPKKDRIKFSYHLTL